MFVSVWERLLTRFLNKMAHTLEDTLNELDRWYNEPSDQIERPLLLSKLAVLELCGWLEGEFDRFALIVDSLLLNDADWVKKNVVERTYGFAYNEHWRQMLVRLVGEVFARKVEKEMNRLYPGRLDLLKSNLGSLWSLRCAYAHADLAANNASQQTFNAPSWARNQYRMLKDLLTKYEEVLSNSLADSKA